MAKHFIDALVTTDKESMTKQDGTALTLTGQVRILYDDAATKADLMVCIERIQERINELELQ
jgi:hypothetical protein